jgi:hypothetical protein
MEVFNTLTHGMIDRTTKCFCEIGHLIGRILFCENSFDGQNDEVFL